MKRVVELVREILDLLEYLYARTGNLDIPTGLKIRSIRLELEKLEREMG